MKTDIRDVLFWMLLVFALVFITLRIIGVINSPDWIDFLPLLSIVFAAGVAYQRLISSIEKIYGRTNYLKKSFDNLENKFNILVIKTENNENRIDNLEKER